MIGELICCGVLLILNLIVIWFLAEIIIKTLAAADRAGVGAGPARRWPESRT